MIAAPPALTVRAAVPGDVPGDVPVLERLIEASARGLSHGHYSAAQVEAAVAHVFGIDSELIADGTYLVAEVGHDITGCGGWSRRRTLFGGDRFAGRAGGLLDPAIDAARIRAFFVAPGHARCGIGQALLAACEEAARAAGFRRLALMATLPGKAFYRAAGYIADPAIAVEVGDISIPFLPMRKDR